MVTWELCYVPVFWNSPESKTSSGPKPCYQVGGATTSCLALPQNAHTQMKRSPEVPSIDGRTQTAIFHLAQYFSFILLHPFNFYLNNNFTIQSQPRLIQKWEYHSVSKHIAYLTFQENFLKQRLSPLVGGKYHLSSLARVPHKWWYYTAIEQCSHTTSAKVPKVFLRPVW